MGQVSSKRYEQRRREIVEAASEILNQQGASALRLAQIADAVGLDLSSLNYYFSKKDLLVAACLERSVLWLEDATNRAASCGSPRERVASIISEHFDLEARQRRGEPPLAFLSDLPSLIEESRRPLEEHMDGVMRDLGGFFEGLPPPNSIRKQTVAANILASNIFWLPAWLTSRSEQEFPRLRRKFPETILNGFILAEGSPCKITDRAEQKDDPKSRFLDAATLLINRHGYKGAKVELVAAELGVSTGSFYHHLRTKDELVTACFDRSFEIIEEALVTAEECPSKGEALIAIAQSIGQYQLIAHAPLLRMASYQALPADLRATMVTRSKRLSNLIAGMIADGIGDGSVLPCDPMIASEVFLASVYGFSGLRAWSEPRDAGKLVDTMTQALRTGIC